MVLEERRAVVTDVYVTTHEVLDVNELTLGGPPLQLLQRPLAVVVLRACEMLELACCEMLELTLGASCLGEETHLKAAGEGKS